LFAIFIFSPNLKAQACITAMSIKFKNKGAVGCFLTLKTTSHQAINAL